MSSAFGSACVVSSDSNTLLAAAAKKASCTLGSVYFEYTSLSSSGTALSAVSVSSNGSGSVTGPIARSR